MNFDDLKYKLFISALFELLAVLNFILYFLN